MIVDLGSASLVLCDNFIADVLWNSLVGVELHGVASTTLSLGAKIGCITEHLAQWHLGTNNLGVTAILHALDLAATAGEVAHNIAHVLLRRFNLNLFDRLEENWIGLLQGVLDCHRASNLEGSLRGVNLVIRAIDELNLDVYDWVTSNDTALEGFLDALIN